MRTPSDTSDIEVSLGFNKIYTDYRPGILMGRESVNRLSRSLDKRAREASKKKYKEEHELHNGSILKQIETCLIKYQLENSNIYIAGHSLGGALATIAALHVAKFLNISLSTTQANSKVSLYTFASPRVGSPSFAQACNERFITYRIANKKDVVPKVPLDKFRILRGPISNFLSRGVVSNIYKHVGHELSFDINLGGFGDNHNMSVTYCHALRNIARRVE